MAGSKTYDPYEAWKNLMINWEKQANDVIHFWTNSRDYIKWSQGATDLQLRYLEMFQRNQQLLLTQLQLPTKKDLANVAKLSIQTEEKLDALEEQLWNVEDAIESTNKQVGSLTEVSREAVKVIKQLKTEQKRDKKELETIDEIHFELLEIKRELAEMNSLKEEIASLKAQLAGSKQDKEKELAALTK
ncbi:polyhydroxyalkanoate biosynthesis repressor PhaR [Neobacillus niacini]|uniref:polyhydroxyalkanoate biosynthesis repressor PhaR n=1 Tax=Neobacillus niacini TaxID=86668 RepID=UPI0021CAF3DD|nr:polyhydroxyalkanoate biosynthesis repressor PhaR [Neobacillus niacini]MCM3767022.1 polyhydroxyalkanoate biosynthesis repressor PhaR [Neobacillus niacini]